MTTNTQVEPYVPEQEVITEPTKKESAVSASLFVARLASQYAFARVIIEGIVDIIDQAISWTPSDFVMGVASLIGFAIVVFLFQFGYKLGINIKWPF